MKKKVFLMLTIVAMLVCALAISTSATTINANTTVTLDGSFTDANGSAVTAVNLYDNEGDALIWYLNTDGKLVSAKIASIVTVNSEGVISFTDQSIFLNKTPRKSVIVVNLRDNVKVSGTDINWDGQIKHFDDSKGTSSDTNIASTGFQFGTYSDSGFTIQYFYFPTSAESIVKRMFQGTPVKVADIEPGTPISTMGMLAFYGASKLTDIYIPNDLAVLPGADGQGLFQNCTSLSKVTFEENSILWNAGQNTFYGCSSLKELYLPNTVRTIGSEFARGSGLEIFSFGAGFEYFTRRDPNKDPDDSHMWVFWGARNLKKVYMPASFAILNDEYKFDEYTSADERLDTFDRIFNSAGSFTLFFTGTKEEIETLKTRMSYTQENQSLMSSLNNIYSHEEYIAAGSPEGSCAVYGYSQCDAFYNGIHKNEITIKYEAFHKDGEKIVGCARCAQNEKTVLSALFTCLGYSAPEFGNGGMAIGFKINHDDVKLYEELTGKTVNYGLFAVSKAKAGTNKVFGENGELLAGAIATDLTSRGVDLFELKITGFTEDSHKSAEIAMGGYVKVADATSTEYSYMQAGTPENGAVYEFVSYNKLASTSSNQ